MTDFPATPRNTVHRLPKRAHYDRETIYKILDEALICHAAFVEDGLPVVIPCLFGREGDTLYLHGAKASRLMAVIGQGGQVSITAALIDGLVLARSVFHHSVNYRSVVVFGAGRMVTDEAEKMHALEVITDHIVPGRWQEARLPNPKEMNATAVVAVPLESATAKLREGGPGDDDEDYDLPVWAGVLPLTLTPGAPLDDPLRKKDLPVPQYIREYKRGE